MFEAAEEEFITAAVKTVRSVSSSRVQKASQRSKFISRRTLELARMPTNTPEEVAVYIAARKKSFPSKAATEEVKEDVSFLTYRLKLNYF